MSNPIGERNLLFGILALHKKFISGAILRGIDESMGSAEKRTCCRSCAEQNALSENQHALLEESMDELVRRNGNDLPKTLASVWPAGPARQELEEITDPDVQAALAKVSTEPILEAEAIVEEDVATPVLAVPVEEAKAKTPMRPKRPRDVEKSSIPAWVLIAGGGGRGAAGRRDCRRRALIVMMFLSVMPVAENVENAAPFVNAEVADVPVQPVEPVVVKPAVKNPPVVKLPENDHRSWSHLSRSRRSWRRATSCRSSTART